MSKIYTFKCVDTDDSSITKVSFETDNDAWSGYNGPMWNFFNFLKGCGFVFDIESDIGVLTKEGKFVPADAEYDFYDLSKEE